MVPDFSTEWIEWMGSENDDRIGMKNNPLGLYIHIPFCRSKCIYCDFSSYAGMEDHIAPYLQALCREITISAERLPKDCTIDTIYLGGGTPGYVPIFFIKKTLDTIRDNFLLEKKLEITIEINPEDRSEEKFEKYALWGINRLSAGFQSLNDDILVALGRRHNSKEALQAFSMARGSGFSNISIDMIIGLPGHRWDTFHQEIEEIIILEPEHISLYLIELDKKTPLARYLKEERMRVSDEATMVELYRSAADLLVVRGYDHYEISNFSLPSRESKHNMKYWTDQSYLGFGSSAHSYFQGNRFSNVCDIKEYISRITAGKAAQAQMDPSGPDRRAAEAVFTGLRLLKGFDPTIIAKRYGIDILERYETTIAHLIGSGLITREGQTLKLTKKGEIFSNEVFSCFV